MSARRGSLVLNEQILPLVDIRLRGGQIEMVGQVEARTAMRLDLRGEAQVFGEDGTLIGAVPQAVFDSGHSGLFHLTRGDTLRVTWRLSLLEMALHGQPSWTRDR